MQPIINSYFSGAGLMDIGLLEAGLDVNQSFEIDETACKTQARNFTHLVIQKDITLKLVKDEDKPDVALATYPCTKYSTIADIHGTRTGDDLFLHFFRHLAIQKPEIYVVENVPGMKKFPIVMEAMTKLPDYYVTTFCPIKSEYWLPQRRNRLIIIGSKRPFNWTEPEKRKPVSLKSIIEKDPVVNVPGAVYSRLSGKYRDKPIISDPEKDDIAPTCVAHYAKDRSTRLVKDINYKMNARPYTVREYARLQGVPDWFVFPCSDNQAYKQIGNGVSVPVGRWIGEQIKRYFGIRGRFAA